MQTRCSARVLSYLTFALLAAAILMPVTTESQTGVTEAPTGFAVVSNGFAEEFCTLQSTLVGSPNSPMIPTEACSFAEAVKTFTGPESIADGLGPIFNAEGCGSCHLSPTLGASSQITNKRAGLFAFGVFLEHAGGSLIQDRATDVAIQEQVADPSVNVTTQRLTTSLLGLGFVEAIANTTLVNIANGQPAEMRGQLINVPVLESPGTTRTGRLGWKNQHASLVSAAAHAYNNDVGVTSPLEPDEPTSNGFSVAAFDTAPVGNPAAPDDDGVDVELAALFIRSTLAPPRDVQRATAGDAQAGRTVFFNIGCATCHTPTLVTAAPGTLINGGALRVSQALGNKVIHPFSDFLLHNVGTGDGIIENGPASTRNKVRTAALWGVRARNRFMHDGFSFNLDHAIMRHGGEAAAVRDAFIALSATNKNRLRAFLRSL
jgi:CxxC motif-containing protein (DUF1111 family)